MPRRFQTAPDGYSRIVWMIKWMIKAHPIKNRMARQAVLDWDRVSLPMGTSVAAPL
jgi:hypothetical protein